MPSEEMASFGNLESRPRIEPQRMTAKDKRRIALYPIILIQIYLAVSVLVFAFGPWQWPVSNPLQLYSFLILAQVALLAGYLQAIKKQPRPASTKLRIPFLVIVSLALNYLWIGHTYEERTGQPFDLISASTAAVAGITNPGAQYIEKRLNVPMLSAEPTSLMGYASFLALPIMCIALPLGMVFWKQLSVSVRVALVGFILIDLLLWSASGMNKGIADYAILLPCMLVARKPAILLNITRNLAKIGVIAILGVGALITFFSVNMAGRSEDATMTLFDHDAGIAAEFHNPVLSTVPPVFQAPLAALSSYFVQGYYALSLSLKEPFIFCYGVGNSFTLEGLSRHIFNPPLYDSTYPARIESKGWDSHGRWDSIYPWIASDLSFPGTIVFMFVLGRVFALVWTDVAFCRNVWAVCVLPQLLTMLFYIPANNQVLGFAPIPFLTMLFLWHFSRTSANPKTRVVLTA
jgi:hypothetical protein